MTKASFLVSIKCRLAFRIAEMLVLLPYSKKTSLLVDRLICYAEDS